jgi:hypothetical protein
MLGLLMLSSYLATLLMMLFTQTAAGMPAGPVNTVVAAVSKNVNEFRELVPDFVCTERITATSFEAGRVREQKTVDSLFSERQKRGEQREIMAINGIPAKKNTKMPGLPTNWNGTFSGMLVAAFSPKILEFYNYSLDSKPGEPGTIVLRFETKKDQGSLKWSLNGEERAARDTGEAWIDPASMQVAHIERHFLNLPRSLTRLDITTDYGPVTIDEKLFWLPRSFRAEGANPSREKTRTFLYTAEYTNCKKFSAEIRLVPQ